MIRRFLAKINYTHPGEGLGVFDVPVDSEGVWKVLKSVEKCCVVLLPYI